MPILTNNSDPAKLFGLAVAVRLSDVNPDFSDWADFADALADIDEATVKYIIQAGKTFQLSDNDEHVIVLNEADANALHVTLAEMAANGGTAPFATSDDGTAPAAEIYGSAFTFNLDGTGYYTVTEIPPIVAKILYYYTAETIYPDLLGSLYDGFGAKVRVTENVPVTVSVPTTTDAKSLLTAINSALVDLDSDGLDVGVFFADGTCDDEA